MSDQQTETMTRPELDRATADRRRRDPKYRAKIETDRRKYQARRIAARTPKWWK